MVICCLYVGHWLSVCWSSDCLLSICWPLVVCSLTACCLLIKQWWMFSYTSQHVRQLELFFSPCRQSWSMSPPCGFQLCLTGHMPLSLFSTAIFLKGKSKVRRLTLHGSNLFIFASFKTDFKADLHETRNETWLVTYFLTGTVLLNFQFDELAFLTCSVRTTDSLMNFKRICNNYFYDPRKGKSGHHHWSGPLLSLKWMLQFYNPWYSP